MEKLILYFRFPFQACGQLIQSRVFSRLLECPVDLKKGLIAFDWAAKMNIHDFLQQRVNLLQMPLKIKMWPVKGKSITAGLARILKHPQFVPER